jgi:hypothetical protein
VTGSVSVSSSAFFDNQAINGGYGGGIGTIYATLNVTNSAIYGNSAASAGGGISAGGTTNVTNSTITGNSSGWDSAGGGINNEGSPSLTIQNTIIANNPTGNNCWSHYGQAGYPFNGSNNLANDDTCGPNFTNSASILLGAAGNYGGSTQTFPLLPGSAAIGATNASCPLYDQRGFERGETCDIGAFESQGFTLAKTAGDNQSANTNTTFANPLALTVTANEAGEPVDGGKISFSAPTSALSPSITNPSFALTVAGGAVSQTVTANSIGGGPYNVTASAAGASSVDFALTNLLDVAPPVITVPADMTVEATGPAGAVVTFAASAVDLEDGPLTPTCSPASGSTFALGGPHPVTCSATDAAGNTGSASFNITVVDTTDPTVSIGSTTTDPTNASPIPVTVTFSESVTEFTADDISVANGTISGFSGAGQSYSFNLTPVDNGPVTVDIAAGAAIDAAGNGSMAAARFTRVYDDVAPKVTLSSTAPASTSQSSIPVTVTFSESVSDFTADDLTVVNGTVEDFSGNGASYTFNLIPASPGLVSVDIAAGAAQDDASNPSAAAVTFSRTALVLYWLPIIGK